MKTNKVLKWLYGLFMFLPMVAIGVTCAYVTFNKNAKDSYSQQIGSQEVFVNEQTTLTDGNFYKFETSEDLITGVNGTYINVDNINILVNSSGTNFPTNTNSFRYYENNNGKWLQVVGDTTQYLKFADTNNNIVAKVVFTFENTNEMNNPYYDNISVIQFVSNNSLDNAFYYAVDQFNESGFNKIDFVSFFDMFYENTNIWTTFANTYMNYVLFVSLAFFIPRVLYWFINLAFSLTDSFERKSQGW